MKTNQKRRWALIKAAGLGSMALVVVSAAIASAQPANLSANPPLSPALQDIEPDGYVLSVGDVVNLAIANVPEYSGPYRIMTNGNANLPVLGQLPLTGLTVPEAEQAIETAYSRAELLVEPVVTITLAEMSPLRVVVIGEINRPGTYTLPVAAGQLPTVSLAIDQAGGITQRTDLRNIQVRRMWPHRSEQTLEVSLWDLLAEGDRTQDISLRNGDTILLPTASSIDLATAETLATSTFSPQAIQVNLVGEITQPGVMQVPPGTPLNQVLLMAGGFTSRSQRSSVKLLRLAADGTVSERRIEIDFEDSVNDETNPLIQNRDVILVGRNFSAQVSDRLGTILSPLNGALSLFNLFLPFLP